ncbi:hypothetical protein ACJMK2_042444 [Sinanodonta woodiana]|uniref:Uncharacterized protein n=1 Tax=Sinanodonta woodiana TaxID=1069815 RepID=A0ABD3W7C7_SINWO
MSFPPARLSEGLSVSDVNQFTSGCNDFSSNVCSNEAECYDDVVSEAFTDVNSSVLMRTERGRYKSRDEPSAKFDSEIEKHFLNLNDPREIEHLERRSRSLYLYGLMDALSPSMSRQEDNSVHRQNDSESDTSACTLTTHNSQGTSSTDNFIINNFIINSTTSNLSSESNTINSSSYLSIVHVQNSTLNNDSSYAVVTGDQNHSLERRHTNNGGDSSLEDISSDGYLSAIRRPQQE